MEFLHLNYVDFSTAMMWYYLQIPRNSWKNFLSLMPTWSFLLKGSAGQTDGSKYVHLLLADLEKWVIPLLSSFLLSFPPLPSPLVSIPPQRSPPLSCSPFSTPFIFFPLLHSPLLFSPLLFPLSCSHLFLPQLPVSRFATPRLNPAPVLFFLLPFFLPHLSSLLCPLYLWFTFDHHH